MPRLIQNLLSFVLLRARALHMRSFWFSSFFRRSLWPLLTGSITRERRPSLADAFYLSRSLWLQSLLAWVSEPWLPRRAREAAARFIQSSLLPFLKSRASSTPVGCTLDGFGRAGREDRGDDGGSGSGHCVDLASRTKRVLRLEGNTLVGIEEEDYGQSPGGFDRVLSDEEEEAKVLEELKSAAIASTPNDVSITAFQPARPEAGARQAGLASTGSTNPFARSTLPGPAASSTVSGNVSKASGSARTPWTERVQAAKPAAPARAKAKSVLSSRSSLPRVDGSGVSGDGGGGASAAAPASDTLESSLFDEEEYLQRSAVRERSQQESGATRPTRRQAGSAHAPRARSGAARGAAFDVGVQDVSRVAAAGPAPAIDDSIGTSLDSYADPRFDVGAGSSGGKKYVTAAEAFAARALRGQGKNTQKEATVVAAAPAEAPRPRGSVQEIWQEMKRKRLAAESATAGSSKTRQQDAGQRAKTPQPKAAVPASAAKPPATDAQAAFAAAAQASAARHNEGLTAARLSDPAPVSPAEEVATLDHASFAKSTAADLHRLVLSSWTVEELRAASSKSGPGGALREVNPQQKNAVGGDRERRRVGASRATGSGDAEEGEISEGTAGSIVRRGRRELGRHGDGKASGRLSRDSTGPAGGRKWLTSNLWLSKVPHPARPWWPRSIFRSVGLWCLFPPNDLEGLSTMGFWCE